MSEIVEYRKKYKMAWIDGIGDQRTFQFRRTVTSPRWIVVLCTSYWVPFMLWYRWLGDSAFHQLFHRHWLSVARACPPPRDRAFPVAAARTWNSLSQHITSASLPAVFGARSKTYLS